MENRWGVWGESGIAPHDQWVNAAVLIPCVRQDGEDFLILTKRTNDVLHHKGQICFPGGAVDPRDRSLWETALREAQEEIGLDPTRVTLVKELGRHFTPTGFCVTPFVGQVEPPIVWRPNPIEIAEIFAVPLSWIRDPRNLRIEKKSWKGGEFLDPHFVYEGREIWGMTGRILLDLVEVQFISPTDSF